MNALDECTTECILSFLNPAEMLHVSQVSRRWFSLANDDNIWERFLYNRGCCLLPISPIAERIRAQSGHKKIAYFIEKAESKRQFITLDDLCGKTWNFRFKEAAGETWMDICPWHRGLPAAKVGIDDGGSSCFNYNVIILAIDYVIDTDRFDSSRMVFFNAFRTTDFRI
jgi:F-box-like